MNSADTPEIRQYLRRLKEGLAGLPNRDCEEILRELRAHIVERSAAPGTSCEDVLGRLGPPEALAAEYRNELLMRHAAQSFSPVVHLKALRSAARKGALGALTCAIACFGYAVGVALVITAILKPVFPSHIGLWVHGNQWMVGYWLAPPNRTELLGWWYMPAALFVGGVVLILTSLSVRSFARAAAFSRGRTNPETSFSTLE